MRKPCTDCEFAYKPSWRKSAAPTPGSKECRSCSRYSKYQDGLEAKREYQIGQKITSMSEFEKITDYVYWRGAIRHIAFLKSMQYRCVAEMIKNGSLCKAIKKEKIKKEG